MGEVGLSHFTTAIMAMISEINDGVVKLLRSPLGACTYLVLFYTDKVSRYYKYQILQDLKVLEVYLQAYLHAMHI